MARDNDQEQVVEEASAGTTRSRWWLLLVVVVLSLLGAAFSIYGVGVLQKARAPDLFRRYVLDPIPASVTDIKVDQPMTHGGYGYVFRFAVSRADLELMRESRPLRETEDIASNGTSLLWAWKDWDSTKPSEVRAVAFATYALVRAPSWYDLAAWKDPEAYALKQQNRDKSTDIQVLLYNSELGQAYFITFHYDGRGL